MSLACRATSCNDKVALITVEGANNIICTLIDKTLKTEDRIQCSDMRQAERLIDEFLRTQKRP